MSVGTYKVLLVIFRIEQLINRAASPLTSREAQRSYAKWKVFTDRGMKKNLLGIISGKVTLKEGAEGFIMKITSSSFRNGGEGTCDRLSY